MICLVHHLLERTAQRSPEAKAVWCQDTWTTYADIQQRAGVLARYLHEHGVRRGDRVAVLFDNSHEYVVSYYAILMAGGVVVSLNTETTPELLKHLLNHCEARAVIASRKYFRFLLPALPSVPSVHLLVTDVAPPEGAVPEYGGERATLPSISASSLDPFSHPHTIDIDLSAIVYTSGSTGEPKGVMLSHRNTVANNASIVEYLQMTSADRMMVVLPFHYVYGKTLLNTHVTVGGSIVIDNRFAYPNAVLQTMQEQCATGFAGVPSTFMILLGKSSLRQMKFPSLRYVTQAGGGMAVSVQKQVVEAFAPAQLFIMYGATEAAPRLTWLPPERLADKWGSIGVAVPNTRVYVADEHGAPVPADSEGEIVAEGSNIMPGYWKDPEGTAKVLRNGLYYTGDLGRMDEEGYLYVVGRSKDMLKIGGNRVSAKEIEDAILAVGCVLEVAVIGVPDPVLGEAARVYAVLKPGQVQDADTIRRELASRLPGYKIPRQWEFRDSLPKSNAGKVMKQQLRSEFQSTVGAGSGPAV